MTARLTRTHVKAVVELCILCQDSVEIFTMIHEFAQSTAKTIFKLTPKISFACISHILIQFLPRDAL